MKLALVAFALIFSSVSFSAESAPKNPVTSTNNSPSNSKVTQTHNFEDLLVQGKYHFSDEAVTTVEDDKVLDSLIGVRSEFKDRIKQSSGLY